MRRRGTGDGSCKWAVLLRRPAAETTSFFSAENPTFQRLGQPASHPACNSAGACSRPSSSRVSVFRSFSGPHLFLLFFTSGLLRALSSLWSPFLFCFVLFCFVFSFGLFTYLLLMPSLIPWSFLLTGSTLPIGPPRFCCNQSHDEVQPFDSFFFFSFSVLYSLYASSRSLWVHPQIAIYINFGLFFLI